MIYNIQIKFNNIYTLLNIVAKGENAGDDSESNNIDTDRVIYFTIDSITGVPAEEQQQTDNAYAKGQFYASTKSTTGDSKAWTQKYTTSNLLERHTVANNNMWVLRSSNYESYFGICFYTTDDNPFTSTNWKFCGFDDGDSPSVDDPVVEIVFSNIVMVPEDSSPNSVDTFTVVASRNVTAILGTYTSNGATDSSRVWTCADTGVTFRKVGVEWVFSDASGNRLAANENESTPFSLDAVPVWYKGTTLNSYDKTNITLDAIESAGGLQ